MKKTKCLWIAAFLAVCGAHMAQAQTQTISLDNAIRGAAEEFSYGLKTGNRVAILVVQADYSLMSDYLIDELNRALAGRQFTVVERARLDQLQDEYNFTTSGELSDATAQAIGRRLDAQAIVTGRFEPVGNSYRFRARVFEVGNAAVLAAYSANVQNDQTIASLMKEEEIAAAPPPEAAPVIVTVVPATPEPAAPAAPSTVTPAPAPAAPSTVVIVPAAPAPAPAPVPSSGYEDFTAGRRWGTWALNAFVLPGLGSYTLMHDPLGGTVQLIVGGLGNILFMVGMYRGLYIDEDDYYDDYYRRTDWDAYNNAIDRAATTMFWGLGLGVANGIFNIVRSATYHKPRPKTAAAFDPNALNIAVLPGPGGIEKVQLSYSMRF